MSAQESGSPVVKRRKVDADAEVEEPQNGGARPKGRDIRKQCPYLDTVNRPALDFDFEKLCSVSLHNLNVYACLVCGVYFQGRGKNTHAYFHSLHQGHHVFINLHNQKVYCLPDNYEVQEGSLDDIKYVVHPTFTPEDIAKLDQKAVFSRGLDGSDYLPGFVGLNNLKKTDYVNVVIQSLIHIPPFRNFFLDLNNYENIKSPLVQAMGELFRKMWNPQNFKGHVSPHELLQAVSTSSRRQFVVGKQSDPMAFMSWLLNTLHRDIGGGKKAGSSEIHKIFQGEIEVTTVPKEEDGDVGESKTKPTTTVLTPFMVLPLDMPPAPLFKDSLERNIIPQVPLVTLLQKYNGEQELLIANGDHKKFRITKLPRYMIIQVKRFFKNNFFMEKNPTIINFPIKNLDLRDVMPEADLTPDLKTRYNLVANVCHDGKPDDGSYRVHTVNKATDQWYEFQDLQVRDAVAQLIALTETYFQIYEQRQD